MKNFIQPGNVITIAAPANVTSGAVVILANIVGIAAYDAVAGAPLEISTEGIFALPKVPADILTQGGIAKVSAGVLGAAGTVAIGWIVANAAAGTTTANVRLTPGNRAGGDETLAEFAAPTGHQPEHAKHEPQHAKH